VDSLPLYSPHAIPTLNWNAVCCWESGNLMTFLPYLQCKNCPGHIQLPLPIQGDKSPRQIAWPWGSLSGNFLCQLCMRPSLYWAEDCRWRPAQNTDLHQTTKPLAVHQIDVPCGIRRCPNLLHILAVMPLESHVPEAASLVMTIGLNGIICDSDHANHGRIVHPAIRCTVVSVGPQGDSLEWATED
jgi:hypothetical protein